MCAKGTRVQLGTLKLSGDSHRWVALYSKLVIQAHNIFVFQIPSRSLLVRFATQHETQESWDIIRTGTFIYALHFHELQPTSPDVWSFAQYFWCNPYNVAKISEVVLQDHLEEEVRFTVTRGRSQRDATVEHCTASRACDLIVEY